MESAPEYSMNFLIQYSILILEAILTIRCALPEAQPRLLASAVERRGKILRHPMQNLWLHRIYKWFIVLLC